MRVAVNRGIPPRPLQALAYENSELKYAALPPPESGLGA